jgi:putative radical SAM enzyme (TIGR03279 family)
MPLKIISIEPGSLAAKSGLKEDDTILSINDKPIDDFLDFQYHSSDEKLIFSVRSNDKEKKYVVVQDFTSPLGIETEQLNCRNCINKCIFCFIDQMRPDIRKSLYVKDDDYRFSFIYGNFITLTNLTDKQLRKIADQKISPLYISVHTTDAGLHKKMLRYSRDFDIKKTLEFLSSNEIELHTQIVVIPGVNDGNELAKSMQDLTSKAINVQSVGLVPVGITKFRNDLTPIRRVNKEDALEILKIAEKYKNTYCSDEIFLTAEVEVPEEDYYDDYSQLENGIGMIRLLLNNWQDIKPEFIAYLKTLKENVVFITGTLFYPYMQKIAKEINETLPGKTRTVAINNDFLGNTVTVAGLIAAGDILSQVDFSDNEIAAVSSNLFSFEDLTIDNITKSVFTLKLPNRKLLVIDEEFAEWELN